MRQDIYYGLPKLHLATPAKISGWPPYTVRLYASPQEPYDERQCKNMSASANLRIGYCCRRRLLVLRLVLTMLCRRVGVPTIMVMVLMRMIMMMVCVSC